MSNPHLSLNASNRVQVDETCRIVLVHCADPQPDTARIARLLERVPQLSRIVIHFANATGVGLRRPVTTSRHAVAVLGSQRIAEILESVLGSPGYVLTGFAQHRSSAVAS